MKQFITSLFVFSLSLVLFTSCYNDDSAEAADANVEFKNMSKEQIMQHLQGNWGYVRHTSGIPGSADEKDIYIAVQVIFDPKMSFKGNQMRMTDMSGGNWGEWVTIEWLKGPVSLGYEYYYYYGLHSHVEFTPEIPVGIRGGMLVLSIDNGEENLINYYYKPI